MEKAAKDLDFMEAARLRDLMFESKKDGGDEGVVLKKVYHFSSFQSS